MFIHIGNRQTVSDRNCIGIFNAETIAMSDINEYYTGLMEASVKLIAVHEDNTISSSAVSPFTILQRTSIADDCLWSKDNA